MSVPGLKPSVEFEAQPAPRLVDRETGQALPLTDTEAQLLHSWDGSPSATRLSATVFMKGLDVEPWQIEQFFERLARAGLLAVERPSIPHYVPATAGVEDPEDLVPQLRGDLVIERSAESKGVMKVRDPKAERTFTLYDFEVSIARMLDGKRSAAEVLTAANRIGIPVTLPTLKTFIQQLKAYKFIDQDVKGGDTTWGKRSQWTEEVRQLYQGALRMLRSGKFDEALSYAEAMEAADPTNAEAKELRKRIQEEARGSLELRVDFDTLHTPVSTDAVAPPKDETGPFASFGFHSTPPSVAELPPIPSAINNPVLKGPTLAQRLKEKKLLLGGVALGVVLLVVLLRPVEVRGEVACELKYEPLGVPRTVRGGKVLKKEVAPGAKVDKGAVLARLGAGESIESLDAKTKELQDQLAALPPPTTGKKAELARARVKKAELAVAQLEKQLQKAGKAQKAGLEKKLKVKKKALDNARLQLDKFTHELARVDLEEQLKNVALRRTGVQAELEKLIVIAPVGGVFVSVGPLPDELQPNDAWGQIVSPMLAVVTRDSLPAGVQTATFRGPGLEAEVAVTDGKAQVPVSPTLLGAKGTLQFSTGRTPWLLSLL